MELRASDSLHEGNTTVVIRVKDINDLPPKFDEASYETTILEEDTVGLPKRILKVVEVTLTPSPPPKKFLESIITAVTDALTLATLRTTSHSCHQMFFPLLAFLSLNLTLVYFNSMQDQGFFFLSSSLRLIFTCILHLSSSTSPLALALANHSFKMLSFYLSASSFLVLFNSFLYPLLPVLLFPVPFLPVGVKIYSEI